MSDVLRYENLPLFNPHRKGFTCVYQDQHVPPVDPQAELWFQQALALDDPDVYYQKRDYPEIYRLYVQAADRGHWKAMLNVASLILRNYSGVPQHNPEVAIQWVEKAMKLGVADAYDMMGIYHQNGMIKGGDATSAYAFFQRAADMGSPSAQTFLGFKMSGSYDSPDGEFWGNATIGMDMLQCALAQGYGDAAYDLGSLYKGTTSDSKLRALGVLHEGVKLGCAKCAKDLASEFRGFDLTSGNNLVGHIDAARAERYFKLGQALEHYQGRLKLPNLDKVLPLPPAPLPKWDGNVKTLIDAAKAVAPSPKKNHGAALDGQERMPEGQGVLSLADSAYAMSGDKSVCDVQPSPHSVRVKVNHSFKPAEPTSMEEQMTRQVIVVGDTLAPFGGEVMTGSDADVVDGKAISRKTDLVNCVEHGINPIAEGDESFQLAGKPAALEGHHATCGCTLVSRRATLGIF
ncbi:PAAR domain-containing protein [Burkholderia vietnamiensis]|uniref:PAAR domain-containing protein n=1 Tax=Burkholderia vietnamiensis TaxID=60552 RepID=UPI00201225E9|nr:PAAR domain-containing protein [Burkholderia vietnamiensis]